MTASTLSRRQLRGLDKLGDVFLPGDEAMPSFSASGCATSIDGVLAYLPAADRKDLGLLLTVLGWLPALLVAGLVALIGSANSLPGPLGALMRFARIGTRGLVMSLYWSHPTVLRAISYEVDVFTDDLAATEAAGVSRTTDPA